MQSTAKTRTREVKFRLTEKELERLNNNVAMTGLSREQYLRVLVSRKIPMALPPAGYRVLIRQMIWVEEELRKIREGSNPDEDMSMLEYTLQVLNNTIVLELDRQQSRIPTGERVVTHMVKIPPTFPFGKWWGDFYFVQYPQRGTQTYILAKSHSLL